MRDIRQRRSCGWKVGRYRRSFSRRGGGGSIKSRHFPINALIKSSRQAVGGSRMSSTTRRKERRPRRSVQIGGAARLRATVSSVDP